MNAEEILIKFDYENEVEENPEELLVREAQYATMVILTFNFSFKNYFRNMLVQKAMRAIPQ